MIFYCNKFTMIRFKFYYNKMNSFPKSEIEAGIISNGQLAIGNWQHLLVNCLLPIAYCLLVSAKRLFLLSFTLEKILHQFSAIFF
jgi:hypothetical protein